ncbi:hypothetical protein SKAU_G00074750 [Synaphobranchus kaupii]|uniref:Uncharacterized protein n=1 Tax=Synaphobranchus kaupii TaxID=118154 RepID=A0A9Q1FEU6_SYNKA|nr:hypothetical protein SKAU_G00198100 [Synaphobranchus kaupii]KAJ8357017.1 hypothetical protein SKAU_G00198110 [Synaphobranchus kaupii]KAJ8369639.1 hypothetical protein SKAU_G00096670 [Synaphobranchus kaupii]KAJ8376895.1 hypothetical protein SKAU_G00074750 [Synaphobranchus kaupii]
MEAELEALRAQVQQLQTDNQRLAAASGVDDEASGSAQRTPRTGGDEDTDDESFILVLAGEHQNPSISPGGQRDLDIAPESPQIGEAPEAVVEAVPGVGPPRRSSRNTAGQHSNLHRLPQSALGSLMSTQEEG